MTPCPNCGATKCGAAIATVPAARALLACERRKSARLEAALAAANERLGMARSFECGGVFISCDQWNDPPTWWTAYDRSQSEYLSPTGERVMPAEASGAPPTFPTAAAAFDALAAHRRRGT